MRHGAIGDDQESAGRAAAHQCGAEQQVGAERHQQPHRNQRRRDQNALRVLAAARAPASGFSSGLQRRAGAISASIKMTQPDQREHVGDQALHRFGQAEIGQEPIGQPRRLCTSRRRRSARGTNARPRPCCTGRMRKRSAPGARMNRSSTDGEPHHDHHQQHPRDQAVQQRRPIEQEEGAERARRANEADPAEPERQPAADRLSRASTVSSCIAIRRWRKPVVARQ